MTGTSAALHATVTVSVLAGTPVTWRAIRADLRDQPNQVRRWHRPGWWLAVVVALLFVNQVMFTVYALRVRHGDMSYLGGYVPAGWFELADGPAMKWLAGHTPAPQLFAVCALRVPSLLELPLGMLAYLTIVNWLDPRWYRRLTTPAVIALTSASYSITFGLIEWAMHTAYTMQDLVLRAVSGVITALAVIRLGRRAPVSPDAVGPRSATDLLAFAASTAALGYLILALYDSVLLYSMGRVDDHLPGAAVAAVVLAGSRLAARRRHGAAPGGACLDALTTGLSWWLALFLIPALAIRYELGFGSRLFAAAAGLLVIAAATIAAMTEVYGRLPVTGRAEAARRWSLGLAVAALVAALAAGFGLAVPANHSEIHLLWAAALFVLAATLVCAAWDRRTPAPAEHGMPGGQGCAP
ncbi:hypothetical protein [Krasilnikovia sp. MM14-A1259]|uniref:hypothetical protein n=1 Tax=Krasilnikovia sp. MM14-A1259 TaxID=3373539 RepID=UPI0037FC3BD6